MPAAIDSTTGTLRDVRRERRAGFAHLLRLDREHDDRSRRATASAVGAANVRDAGKRAASFARCASTGSTTR